MKYLNRTAALLLTACLLAGCSKAPAYDPQRDMQQDAAPLSEQTAAEAGTLTTTVRCEALTLPEAVECYLSSDQDGVIGESYGSDNTYTRYVFNEDLTSFTKSAFVTLTPHDGFYYMGGLFAFGGDTVYSLATMENHSGMEPPFGKNDADFDWDTYNSTWETEHYLCTYTKDGTLTGSTKIEGLEKYQQTSGYYPIRTMLYTEQGLYLFLEEGIVLRMEPDGTYTETAPKQTEREYFNVMQAFPCSSGRILLSCEYNDPSRGYHNDLIEFDPAAGTYGELVFDSESGGEYGTLFYDGNGEYPVLVDRNGSVCGMKEDGSLEKLIDWKDSDLGQMRVCPLADGSFIGIDYYTSPNRLFRLTRLRSNEIQERQKLTLGVVDGLYDDAFIRTFNNSQEQYRLELMKYADLSEVRTEEEAAELIAEAKNRLKLDMVSGSGPDLILMDDAHSYFEAYGSKGMFTDLTEFLATDTTYNNETIVESYLNAAKSADGALYAIAPDFAVGSMAVKEKFGVSENWTMQEMIALYDEHADDVNYKWSTRWDMLETLLCGVDFTDEAAGRCSFDTPVFTDLLEFCARFPEELQKPDKEQDGWEAVDAYYSDSYYRFQRDEDYAFPVTFNKMGSVTASPWAYAEADLGEPFTLAGYPSDDGHGAKLGLDAEIAITSSCKDKAGAWLAAKAYLDTGFEYESAGFSILDKVFEEQLDDYMYIFGFDEEDGTFGRTDRAEGEDKGRALHPLSQEGREHLEAYIRSCSSIMTLDEHVRAIIWEEAGMYFSGQRSAEETARMIQSRAELYMSEQY